jgi:hypothetical protein
MNRKFALTLLSTPILFASMLSTVIFTQEAHANQVNSTTTTCVNTTQTTSRKLVCQRVTNTPGNVKEAQVENDQPTELKFTDEESDQAVRLFGCDCPVCINAVKKINGLAPMAV